MTDAANDDTKALKKQVADLTKDRDGLADRLGKATADFETQGAKLDEAVDAQRAAVAERDDFAKKLEAAEGDHAKTSDALGKATVDLETVTGERDAGAKKIAELEAAVADATKRADKAEADLAKAKNAGSVSRGKRAPQLRAVGPMPDSHDPIEGKDLIELLKDGGPYTIVLSDGQRELDGVAPIAVTGNAWSLAPAGVMLTEPVTVTPESRVTIAGFGLLDEDGTQLAWSELPTPVSGGGGTSVKLDRQIVF